MDLKNKNILVTGGAKRIGKTICEALADHGANIIIHYNTSEKEAKDLQTQLRKKTGRVFIFQADLGKSSDIIKMMPQIEKEMDGVDILINNASIFESAPLENISESDWDRHIDINLKAPFLLAQRVSQKMIQKKYGKIINITDASVGRPYTHYLHYCASKGGLDALTKALAKELAPHIQVNSIAPGPIIPSQDYSEEQRRKSQEKTLLKRWGDPKNIAQAVLFLIEADFVTGTTVTIDGGRLIV